MWALLTCSYHKVDYLTNHSRPGSQGGARDISSEVKHNIVFLNTYVLCSTQKVQKSFIGPDTLCVILSSFVPHYTLSSNLCRALFLSQKCFFFLSVLSSSTSGAARPTLPSPTLVSEQRWLLSKSCQRDVRPLLRSH